MNSYVFYVYIDILFPSSLGKKPEDLWYFPKPDGPERHVHIRRAVEHMIAESTGSYRSVCILTRHLQAIPILPNLKLTIDKSKIAGGVGPAFPKSVTYLKMPISRKADVKTAIYAVCIDSTVTFYIGN